MPKFLLEYFLNEHGNLWCSQQGETRVYQASSVNMFVQKDLYTHFDPELDPHSRELRRTPDNKPEDELSRLEGRAAFALKKLIHRTRAFMRTGNIRDFRGLDGSDVMACKEFFVSMTHRTPQVLNVLLKKHIIDEAKSQVANAEDAHEYPGDVLDGFVETIVHAVTADFASSAHDQIPYDYAMSGSLS